MAKTSVVRVDNSLIDVFGRISSSFANKIKAEYNLQELFVSDMLASQIVAGQVNGKGSFEFRVRKTGLNKGVLELV